LQIVIDAGQMDSAAARHARMNAPDFLFSIVLKKETALLGAASSFRPRRDIQIGGEPSKHCTCIDGASNCDKLPQAVLTTAPNPDALQ
jgi:hypothetical protein